MPPRLSIQPLVRKLQAFAPQPRASISTTSKKAAIKDIGASSASRKLLDFDDSATTTGVPNERSAGDALNKMMQRSDGFRGIARSSAELLERTQESKARGDMARQMTRSWKDGDVYAPHDLSEVEMMKWKQPKRPNKDIIDMLGLNPLDHYKNFAIMSEFMTDMGRIKHSNETGLRPVNQRKMAKAIRRAIGMGIHPSTHKHPEILFGESKAGPRYQNSKIPEEDRSKSKI